MRRDSLTSSEIFREKQNNANMLVRRRVIEKMNHDIMEHFSESPDYFTLEEYDLFKKNIIRENVFGSVGIGPLELEKPQRSDFNLKDFPIFSSTWTRK